MKRIALSLNQERDLKVTGLFQAKNKAKQKQSFKNVVTIKGSVKIKVILPLY